MADTSGQLSPCNSLRVVEVPQRLLTMFPAVSTSGFPSLALSLIWLGILAEDASEALKSWEGLFLAKLDGSTAIPAVTVSKTILENGRIKEEKPIYYNCSFLASLLSTQPNSSFFTKGQGGCTLLGQSWVKNDRYRVTASMLKSKKTGIRAIYTVPTWLYTIA